MDYKHRVYYLVNFNCNHNKEKFSEGWDEDGHIHNNNLKTLQVWVKSLKITPNRQGKYTNMHFQRKVSCLKKDEGALLDAFKKLDSIEYVKIR